MNRLTTALLIVILSCAQAFGAEIVIKPGDNAQAKVNTYRANDTILFEGSRTGAVINVPNNGTLTITATPGTVLSATHHSFHFMFKGAVGVTVRNIDLAGGGIYMQDCSWMNVNNIKLHDIRNNGNNAQHGIYHLNIRDSAIHHNEFWNIHGPGGDCAVFGFYPKRLTVNFNKFHNNNEDIHTFYADEKDQPGQNKIIGNKITMTWRHSIEEQYKANDVETAYNWISGRYADKNGMGISHATGGKPGQVGATGDNTSWNARVHHNVIDFRGNKWSDYSQNACVEAMAHIDIYNNWFIGNDTGKMQAIVHSQNERDWKAHDNLYQNISNFFSGGKGGLVVQPLPENQKNNNKFNGEPPTYEQLIAMIDGTPPPPPPALKLTVYHSSVKVDSPRGATVKKRAGEGGFRSVVLDDKGFDRDFDFSPTANEIASTWRFAYVATENGVDSPEQSVQMGIGPKEPTDETPPPPPIETILPGNPYPVIVPINNGAPDFTRATTKPVQ